MHILLIAYPTHRACAERRLVADHAHAVGRAGFTIIYVSDDTLLLSMRPIMKSDSFILQRLKAMTLPLSHDVFCR
jgi:hypothetical protein